MTQITASLEELLEKGVVWTGGCSSSAVLERGKFGIEEIDSSSGGLAAGVLHEFALDLQLSGKHWYSPLHIIAAILSQTISGEETVAWIGQRCWPGPDLLKDIQLSAASWDWSKRCLFIDPPTKEKRLWAAAQALCSPAIAVVVADASGFSFLATRRLQLAVKERRTMALLIRPPEELQKISAARTKWCITPTAAAGDCRRWNIKLVRAKGAAPELSWQVEWSESAPLLRLAVGCDNSRSKQPVEEAVAGVKQTA